MRYITLNQPEPWQLIYCDKNFKETTEDVAKALLSVEYIKPFKIDEHESMDATKPIINDRNMFIMKDISYGIWQVGSKCTDANGVIIPHLYQIRKVAYMI